MNNRTAKAIRRKARQARWTIAEEALKNTFAQPLRIRLRVAWRIVLGR